MEKQFENLIHKYVKNFDTLDISVKKCIINMCVNSANNNKMLEIKKLLSNSIYYLINDKINKIDNFKYTVFGNHGKYNVIKYDDIYTCECPMYNKNGKYSKIQNQKCSHIQAVELFECININNNYIFLLSGNPGCGKSYCINNIIENYKNNSMSMIVSDTVVNGVRNSFKLTIRKRKNIIIEKTFATKIKNNKFKIKIGKWFVNPKIFDKYAVRMINIIINKINTMDNEETFLFVIDELGKMQSTSDLYVKAINNLFETIENNKYKKFIGIFIVPTENSKWTNLDKLKKKYKTFNININSRTQNQSEFINMIFNLNL